jgi:O-antigen ligase
LSSLLIILIIPGLIWGPFVPDLIVSLSSLVFLVYVFKNKEYGYFKIKPLIIFFSFCLYCIVVSVFVASDVLMSFQSSLFYFRIGVFACVIWYLIEQDKKYLVIFIMR